MHITNIKSKFAINEQVDVFSLGVKEIDIAATLEHIRDQRPGLVRTKVLLPIHTFQSGG